MSCVLGDAILWFSKKIPCLAGKFWIAAVQTDHFRFSLISRDLNEKSQKFKRHLFRCLVFKGDTIFWFSKSIIFGGKIQTCRRTDWPFPIFPHILRTKWDTYLKNLKGMFSGFVLVGDTILWLSKNDHIWRENPKLPPYRLTISNISSYLEI